MKSLLSCINENINTHSYIDLQKQLRKFYANEIHSFIRDKNEKFSTKSPFYIEMNGDRTTGHEFANELTKQEKFKQLLAFYNYFPSYVWMNKIYIEPIFPKKENDYIYNNCNGIMWHIAYKHHVDSILKSGFKIKKPSYRDYPSRIYVYATEDNNPDSLLDDSDFIKFIEELGREDDLNKQVLLKIDLSNTQHNIDFYNDVAMKCKHVFFTYTNIPAKFISKIAFDFDELKLKYF